MPVKWNDALDAHLRQLAADGLSTLQAADALGCSRQAVAARAHKRQIRFRPMNDGRRLNGPVYTGWRRHG